MIILLILLIALTIFVLALAMNIIRLSQSGEMSKIVSFLDRFINIIFILIGVAYVIGLIVSFISLASYELGIILTIQLIIRAYFFYVIYHQTKFLLSQLKLEVIFEKENANAVKKVAQAFLLMSAVEIVAGLLMGVFFLFTGSNPSFSIEFNIDQVILITIGFILLIVSLIYHKAIEIYEENQLTI
jgi:hypothetical protein